MRPIKPPTFILPRILRLLTIGALIGCGIGYAFWQGRNLINGPELSITSEPAVVQNGRVVYLEGVAENVTALYLNGRSIVTDQHGKFTEGIVLENGYSVVSLDAHDRFGREIHWEKPVVYVEENGMAKGETKEDEIGL